MANGVHAFIIVVVGILLRNEYLWSAYYLLITVLRKVQELGIDRIRHG